MKFEEKLKKYGKKELFDEYCSFLDLSIDEYMKIQNSLLEEQIELWQNSKIGQHIIKDKRINNISEFKKIIPLTKYDDYAEILLKKDDSYLPLPASLWIETTWEGGTHPVKVAPYTKGIIQTLFTNMCAMMMIATGKERYDFDIKSSYHMLYGLAPLPYATGLIPLGLDDQIGVEFLPPTKIASSLSFSERNKLGFKMGMIEGIEYFFGLGSVAYYVSNSLSQVGSGGKTDLTPFIRHPFRLMKLIKGKNQAKKENRPLLPKDLFSLKGFVVAGTDNRLYKDELERMWGVKPLEIFAGTEPTFIGTELYSRQGLTFFPDACFYEFILEEDLLKEEQDPKYIVPTYTMDQVQENHVYEIVLSVFRGGAFMRYRVGDMYRCVSVKNSADKTNIPSFVYIDRIKDIIDIAGFTRISKNSIDQVISLSKLDIVDYIAKKEIDADQKPFLHLYVEIDQNSSINEAITVDVIREHLSVYFKYFDQDYGDLKKILGIEPLQVTILKNRTLTLYNEPIRKINPSAHDIQKLLDFMKKDFDIKGGSHFG